MNKDEGFMKNGLAILAAALLLSSTAIAQQTPQAQGANQTQAPASPVVQPDGRVTFSLLAPAASRVTLDGDHPIGNGYRNGRSITPMTKDGNGVWSTTVGPLKPEIYSYYFLVDGIRTLDPGNASVNRDGTRYANWLVVPGAGSANYLISDAPHGQVHEVWYASPTLKMTRRLTVYTPPGYENGTERYPVFYLQHGGGGDEDAWTDLGRVPEIFDNLIAQGKMVPMIVVMGNGNAWQNAAPSNLTETPNVSEPQGAFSSRTAAIAAYILKYPDSIVQDLVPFVDKTYRTKADREDRAIAGLSMGGAQALYTAINHLDTFSWVGVFSGGLPLLPGVMIDIPMPADADTRRGPDVGHSIDPMQFASLMPSLGPEVNSKLRLFYLTIGDDDGLVESYAAMRKLFDEKGVKYTWVDRPGYGHEWSFWRLSLQDFSSRLFKPGR
jgi:enterochelin esterase family protein